MALVDHLRRQFAYDDWANREVLAGLRAGGITTGRPVQLMAHIRSAEATLAGAVETSIAESSRLA